MRARDGVASVFSGPTKLHLALIGLVAIALAGCQCGTKERDADADRRQLELAVPPPPVRVLGERLVTAGQSPATLRYRLPGGERYRLEKSVTATVEEIIDTERQPERTLPAVGTGFDLIARPGALEVAVAEPAVEAGAEAAAAEAQLARYRTLLAGVRGRIGFDDRGRLGRVGSLDPGDGGLLARRELAAALVDSIVVLPEQPVGVGGRWEVTRAIPRGASAVKQIADYELLARDGDRLTVKLELLTIGERQPISLPNLPPGARGEMLALRVFVEGEVTLDLASPTPLSGTLRRRDKIHVRTVAGGRTLSDYYSESDARIVLETRGPAR